MQRNVDIKNRVVDYHDVNTGDYEEEIINYLNKRMKVRFHSAHFTNKNYVFTGKPEHHSSNSITVSGYRRREPGETNTVVIG